MWSITLSLRVGREHEDEPQPQGAESMVIHQDQPQFIGFIPNEHEVE